MFNYSTNDVNGVKLSRIFLVLNSYASSVFGFGSGSFSGVDLA